MLTIDRLEVRTDVIDIRGKSFYEFGVLDFMRFYKLVELLLEGWVVHGIN